MELVALCPGVAMGPALNASAAESESLQACLKLLRNEAPLVPGASTHSHIPIVWVRSCHQAYAPDWLAD